MLQLLVAAVKTFLTSGKRKKKEKKRKETLCALSNAKLLR